jgi:hypothetical protein
MMNCCLPRMTVRACQWCLIGILMLLVVPCACSSSGAEDKPKALTPLNELPPEYERAWRAFRQNSEEWATLRQSVREDSKLANFFVDNLMRVLIRSYDHAALAAAGQKGGAFERGTREILYLHEHSGPVLVELIMVGDPVVSFLAGDLLMQIDDGRWSVLVAIQIENEDHEERRRACEWLAKLPIAGPEEDVVWQHLTTACEDPTWFVRAQAVLTMADRSLARGRVDLALGPLSRALSDNDKRVLQAACEAVRRTRDRAAIPALINALQRLERERDDVASLRSMQRTLLVVSRTKEERRAEGWRDWWHENRNRRN